MDLTWFRLKKKHPTSMGLNMGQNDFELVK